MPKGYWIAQLTVKDPERYPDYMAAASAAIKAHGGNYLIRGGTHERPERPGHDRNVVIEFESYAQAQACYHSPAYQEAVKLRQAYAESDIVIVEGA